MDKTNIYCFSGTGNSLYVAKELQKLIPESSLRPITPYLKKKSYIAGSKTIGFVFPVHGMTVPIPVKNFIKKIDLYSSKYIFVIITRGGTKTYVKSKIENLLKKKGKKLNSFFIITMANNDPKLESFEVPTENEISEMKNSVHKHLVRIKNIIINNEEYSKKDNDYVDFSFIKPINLFLHCLILLGVRYAEHVGVKDYFYSDSKCNGCGICAKVCQSGKIIMNNNKPSWQKEINCYLCYACLNYCPAHSIQIKTTWYMKSHTKEKERYPHPFAAFKDIAWQKKERS